MTLSFKITNTTSSEVELKVDNQTVQSEFACEGSSVTFTLTDTQINKSKLITIENSDVVYDLTQSCKEHLEKTPKQIIKVDPNLGILNRYIEESVPSKSKIKPDPYNMDRDDKETPEDDFWGTSRSMNILSDIHLTD